MTKVIHVEVESCADCPWSFTKDDIRLECDFGREKFTDGRLICEFKDGKPDFCADIPKWCPLPDKEKP